MFVSEVFQHAIKNHRTYMGVEDTSFT